MEFDIGKAFEQKHDFEYRERITLEVRGNLQWNSDYSRLELVCTDFRVAIITWQRISLIDIAGISIAGRRLAVDGVCASQTSI